mmetsp:Transcript_38680/g.87929  ORF Transcript_38680/g.87929 Transcript_38680/m.87929 type:complete len:110 (+) Transcript_38680:1165-1494(+)
MRPWYSVGTRAAPTRAQQRRERGPTAARLCGARGPSKHVEMCQPASQRRQAEAPEQLSTRTVQQERRDADSHSRTAVEHIDVSMGHAAHIGACSAHGDKDGSAWTLVGP